MLLVWDSTGKRDFKTKALFFCFFFFFEKTFSLRTNPPSNHKDAMQTSCTSSGGSDGWLGKSVSTEHFLCAQVMTTSRFQRKFLLCLLWWGIKVKIFEETKYPRPRTSLVRPKEHIRKKQVAVCGVQCVTRLSCWLASDRGTPASFISVRFDWQLVSPTSKLQVLKIKGNVRYYYEIMRRGHGAKRSNCPFKEIMGMYD